MRAIRHDESYPSKFKVNGECGLVCSLPNVIVQVNGDKYAERPQGQRRPADAMGWAIMVGQRARGEIAAILKKPSEKVSSGKVGSKARMEKLSQEERTAIAKKAAARRWG